MNEEKIAAIMALADKYRAILTLLPALEVRAALEAALRAQASEPEPFGYVVTNNFPADHPYRFMFYLPDQIATAYKDNALESTPVFTHPALRAQDSEPAADERAAFEAADFDYPPIMVSDLSSIAPGGKIDPKLQDYFYECVWTGWQARAIEPAPVVLEPLSDAEALDIASDYFSDLRDQTNAVDMIGRVERAHGIGAKE